MPLWKNNSSARDALAQAAAIGRSQAVIEFKMDGMIVTANQNFLDAMGYRLDEIVGEIFRKLLLMDVSHALGRLLAQQNLILRRHELTP